MSHSSEAIKPNQDFWAQADQVYNDVTTSRPWRHTIGRISCAMRIPLYALVALFQVAKMGIKLLPAIPFTIIAWATGTRKLDSWTFKGIALDGVMAVKFLDKIGSSALGVIFAPPKKYHSLGAALKNSFYCAIGKHQSFWTIAEKAERRGMTPPKLGDIAFKILSLRAAYSKIIIQQDKIYDMEPCFCFNLYRKVSEESLEKIKSA